jgi:TonB family protein
MFKRTSICPFCFEKINLHKVDFRCTNDPQLCPPENDAVLAKFLRVDSQMMNKVVKIPPPATLIAKIKSWLHKPQEATCHSCHEKTTTRLCPHCHSELPYTMGDYKDLIFAVIGAKEAGKSHYISVLINTIRNEIGDNFDCSLQPLNEETMTRYREVFYNPVFRKSEVIPATHSARADFNVRTPLIYTLSFRGKGFLRRKTIRQVVTIAFFDTAGEDLNAEDTMRTENKYIYNSSGIILLLDPLQLRTVRAELPDNTPLPDENTETEDLVDRVAKLIRIAHGIKGGKLINIPIAVAFSKIDALEPLLEGSSLNYASKHEGHFDLEEFGNVSDEMESRVREWSGSSLINSLKNSFKTHAFFGLTALGCNPHKTHKIEKLRPRRIEEPFLWLLWKYKLISDQTFMSKFFLKLKTFKLPIFLGVVLLALMFVSFFKGEPVVPEETPVVVRQPTPVDFVRAYYNDINNGDADSAIRKWKLPKADILRTQIKRVKWLKINKIHWITPNYENAQVSVDVSGKLKGKGERRSVGTLVLEKVTGEWKISEMHLQNLIRIMTGAGVYLRYKPQQSARKPTKLQIGTIVYSLEKTVNAAGNEWYRIATSNGKKGWVLGKYTMHLDWKNREQAYVEVANQKLNNNSANFGDLVELCLFLSHVSNQVTTPERAAELKLLYLLALQRSLENIPRNSSWLKDQETNIEYNDVEDVWSVKRELYQELYKEYRDLPIAARIHKEMPPAKKPKKDIQQVIAAINKEVTNKWIRPHGYYGGLSSLIDIRLKRGGTVAAVKIITSSGNSIFDASALKAVYDASPLAVPDEVFSEFRHFQFRFSQ